MSSPSADPGDRYVLVKSFRGGGLGDAFRAVVLALLYAEKTKRKVIVDWCDGSFGPEGVNAFSQFFRLAAPHDRAAIADVQDNQSVLPPRWRGNLERTLRSLWIEDGITGWDRSQAQRLFSFDQRVEHEEQVCVMWDFDALSAYSLSAIQAAVHRFLRLQPEIEQMSTAFAAERFGKTMLGVHIRAANEEQVKRSSPSQSTIRAAVQKLLDTGRYQGIFLSTDHFPTQQWFQNMFPGTIVRQKPFPDDGSPLHLSDFGQPRLEQTRDALMDMVLLSSCSGLVHPGSSSFSLSAIYMSRLPSEACLSLQQKRPPGRRIVSALARFISHRSA